jgi:hypothetical protein
VVTTLLQKHRRHKHSGKKAGEVKGHSPRSVSLNATLGRLHSHVLAMILQTDNLIITAAAPFIFTFACQLDKQQGRTDVAAGLLVMHLDNRTTCALAELTLLRLRSSGCYHCAVC